MKNEDELNSLNIKLAFQNKENEKRSAELEERNLELKNAEISQKEYIQGLEQIMHMTSHQVRQPIANIIGLSRILDLVNDSNDEIKETIDHIQKSALSLETLTRELNEHVLELKKKIKA